MNKYEVKIIGYFEHMQQVVAENWYQAKDIAISNILTENWKIEIEDIDVALMGSYKE